MMGEGPLALILSPPFAVSIRVIFREKSGRLFCRICALPIFRYPGCSIVFLKVTVQIVVRRYLVFL
jgi:hypothetical protein